VGIPICGLCGRDKLGPGPICWHCKQSCEHITRQPVVVQKRNGTREVKLRCDRCWDMQIGQRARDYDLPALPVHVDHRDTSHLCARCGHHETEEHHFAPVALFGWDEAQKWPTAWLCPRCHRYWHRVIDSAAAASTGEG
jgi:hypothetical protein